MAFEILDLTEFLDNGIAAEAFFMEAARRFDWSRYEGKNVLVKGCGLSVVPPWAYMIITARLTRIARSIRYGNDHDNLVVYRQPR